MGRNSIRLGKLFGIEIALDWSWILIFALVTWSLAQHYLVEPRAWSVPLRWGLALITSLLFFSSVLAHELAHSLVSRAQGIPVPRITLFLFGGVSQISEQPHSAWNEFWMALVGPLTSLGLAGVFGLIWFVARQPSAAVAEIAGWLAAINLTLALFNLLPGFPLDGGRVLRAIVWGITRNLRRATQVAVSGGILLAWALVLLGIWQVLDGNWSDGLWIAVIGWFLQGAAVQEGQSTAVQDLLRGHKVREVRLGECQPVFKQLTLDVFVESVAVQSGRRCFSVMDGDRLVGLVTMHRLQQVPRDKWPTTHIADIIIPPEKLITARLDEDLVVVLDEMARADVNQLPVVENGRFLGVVTRGSIIEFLRQRVQSSS